VTARSACGSCCGIGEPAVKLPACFDGYTLVVGDGKKIKDAAKRLAPTRGYRGKLLGAKTLVALELRSGMALAMSDSLDGMTNDVPLVPELMTQLHQIVAGPMLTVWTGSSTTWRRCGGSVSAMAMPSWSGPSSRTRFSPWNRRWKSKDEQGRRVLDEIGIRGQDKKQMRVRRITLFRKRWKQKRR